MIIFERIKKKELRQDEAAKLLKLSDRQVRRKLKRYRLEGAEGLIHKSRRKKSNRAINSSIAAEILRLLQEKYLILKDRPGPTFLADQLAKNDGIVVDHETLRRFMISEGLWVVANRKRRQHQWRERKHHVGELEQVDGSLHIWFGEEHSTLIAFIDDATGKFQMGEFVDHESTEDLGRLTRDYIEQHGRPLAMYSDRGSTYKVNNKDGKVHKTQYQRMLQEAGIELIYARSPQAKGRVERLFKTLQDRLVKELELAGITTREAANAFLKNVYIPEHNAKFAVEPFEKSDFHRSADGFNLNTIFCLKFERTINNDYTISFKDTLLQLERSQQVSVRCGQRVSINEYFDGTIDIIGSGTRLAFKRITKQIGKPRQRKDNDVVRRGRKLVYHKPKLSHPWRTYGDRPDISTELKKGHF
jgi:transposase